MSERKTVDLCQDCWQVINPTEYYPEAVRYDECYGCGDTRLVIRTPRLDWVLGYAEPEPLTPRKENTFDE
jgi:hypothetical protein